MLARADYDELLRTGSKNFLKMLFAWSQKIVFPEFFVVPHRNCLVSILFSVIER